MNIVCIGGGPAGLYFSLLMKQQDPAHRITVVERNRPYDTFGWGVVFSDQTLGNLQIADPKTATQILDALPAHACVHRAEGAELLPRFVRGDVAPAGAEPVGELADDPDVVARAAGRIQGLAHPLHAALAVGHGAVGLEGRIGGREHPQCDRQHMAGWWIACALFRQGLAVNRTGCSWRRRCRIWATSAPA